MNMNILLLVATIVGFAMVSESSAQTAPIGRWSGPIQIPGIELPMNVHFSDDGSATIDIPPQGAFGLALLNVKTSSESVYFELQAGPGLAVFKSTSVSDTLISGSFTQGAALGTFYLEPNHKDETFETHAAEEEVSVAVPGGELFGALAMPPGVSIPDLVILHAGSGPTTRDGNSQGLPMQNNSLLLLSDGLVEQGLAVLRYDKRGIGNSVKTSEAELRLMNYADDLMAWIAHMRDQSTFGRIVLAGHSEGALISTLAAQRADVDGLILIAGAGRNLSDVLLEQLERNLPANLFEESQLIISDLLAGKTAESPPQELLSLFRPSVQPYLMSMFDQTPSDALALVSAPTLIIQGTTDIQISLEDAHQLASAQPQAKLVVIEGMNHVLKDVEGNLEQQAQSYGDPGLPVNKRLVTSISAFVTGLK